MTDPTKPTQAAPIDLPSWLDAYDKRTAAFRVHLETLRGILRATSRALTYNPGDAKLEAESDALMTAVNLLEADIADRISYSAARRSESPAS